MRNLAIIPARSGSKGLRDKNIKLLNGRPLLAYSIDAALSSGMFEHVMVSTDSGEYSVIAQKLGACVPFLRSPQLADDEASSWDVVRDVISRYEEVGEEFDTVALLQPTSPLRTADDITAGYQVMRGKDADVVISVCETCCSPLWSNTLPENGSMEGFLRLDLISKPRQSLPVYYKINGALYIVRTTYLKTCQSIYGKKSFALIMSRERSVDIDDEIDFVIAEALMEYSAYKKLV